MIFAIDGGYLCIMSFGLLLVGALLAVLVVSGWVLKQNEGDDRNAREIDRKEKVIRRLKQQRDKRRRGRG